VIAILIGASCRSAAATAQTKGNGDLVMTIMLMLFFLLFTVFCTVILALGISDAYGKKKSERPIDAAATHTPDDDSDRTNRVD
jgi:hypothetical protein